MTDDLVIPNLRPTHSHALPQAALVLRADMPVEQRLWAITSRTWRLQDGRLHPTYTMTCYRGEHEGNMARDVLDDGQLTRYEGG